VTAANSPAATHRQQLTGSNLTGSNLFPAATSRAARLRQREELAELLRAL